VDVDGQVVESHIMAKPVRGFWDRLVGVYAATGSNNGAHGECECAHVGAAVDRVVAGTEEALNEADLVELEAVPEVGEV
jgi:hypothetical protein